ncbi:sugar transferase [Xanthomarina sp. F1114]|uniref:sugar transferase n=1 Tax=Xanthomarina sp. F1114 TaxID=2996019 RepID=UPI00225E0663|nr:sugar transferase [Xanthomarina sp. F1114]MCX7548873.1 sugar transferase [Xanthomarina sp. F1114]
MKTNFSSSLYSLIKRVFDMSVAAIGILLISPLFIIIMVVLKFTGEGEIFYLQERMGLNNKPFFIYKFATMLKDSANMGHKALTVRNDPRITKVGKLLRITKINELPQIINVIKGDMALVGPRPNLPRNFQKYAPEVQAVIFKNRPGITGIGSLVFRDEELLVTTYKELGKNPSDYYKNYIYPYKGELEKWYYHNCSISVDLKILFLTFWSLVNKDSQRVFKSLKDLPAKPETLTVAGIAKL